MGNKQKYGRTFGKYVGHFLPTGNDMFSFYHEIDSGLFFSRVSGDSVIFVRVQKKNGGAFKPYIKWRDDMRGGRENSSGSCGQTMLRTRYMRLSERATNKVRP